MDHDDTNPIELLERALTEIDALQAIYGCDGDDENENEQNYATANTNNCSNFAVISKTEFQIAKRILQEEQHEEDQEKKQMTTINIPQLEIEIQIPHPQQQQQQQQKCSLRCRLPPGYPMVPAKISVSVVEGLSRTQRDALSVELSQMAESMSGFESIMSLVDTFKDMLSSSSLLSLSLSLMTNDGDNAVGSGSKNIETITATTTTISSSNNSQGTSNDNNNNNNNIISSISNSSQQKFGRRWIWVHHIKDTNRRKSILQEARDLKLGGYLKYGYPGIIVIEGTVPACDEFVVWVKGNKSRPGGFGRNWGHHVRGEINNNDNDGGGGAAANNNSNSSNKKNNNPNGSDGRGGDRNDGFRRLPPDFVELEDLAVLGSLCKDHGLEDEFLEYVMQHKGSSNS